MMSQAKARAAQFGLGVAVLAGVMVVNPLNLPSGGSSAQSQTGPSPRDTGELVVRSLERTVEVDGELIFVETATAITTGAAGGTITAVAPVGETVEPGGVLFEVDGKPSVALAGPVPAWRTMSVGDVGPDVAQLEAGLVALGYDVDGLLNTDDTYTAYTADLVAAWQDDIGRPDTGTVDLGSVAFIPDGAMVAAAMVTTGDEVQGQASTVIPVLSLAGPGRAVVFTVDAADADTVDQGVRATVRLPDRRTVEASVTSTAIRADGSLLATAELIEPADLPAGSAVPVSVTWTVPVADEAVTVAASSLTRLDGGGYAVEVVTPLGDTEFVTVEIGARSGATVEIITDLEPGTIIIAP